MVSTVHLHYKPFSALTLYTARKMCHGESTDSIHRKCTVYLCACAPVGVLKCTLHGHCAPVSTLSVHIAHAVFLIHTWCISAVRSVPKLTTDAAKFAAGVRGIRAVCTARARQTPAGHCCAEDFPKILSILHF